MISETLKSRPEREGQRDGAMFSRPTRATEHQPNHRWLSQPCWVNYFFSEALASLDWAYWPVPRRVLAFHVCSQPHAPDGCHARHEFLACPPDDSFLYITPHLERVLGRVLVTGRQVPDVLLSVGGCKVTVGGKRPIVPPFPS